MICGNEHAKTIIQSYFNKIQSGNIPFRFLLLDGPENIGKTTLIKKISKELLGQYFNNDFLFIKDLSKYIGKKHTIKIGLEKKDLDTIQIEGIGNFSNWGTREIIDRLYKSPLGKYKILLLENIERMTNQASNAFLKTFEEPLPGRIIIATTSNKNNLLDTIISRAFITKFEIPQYNITKDFLTKQYPHIESKNLDLIISFAMGRIGFAIQLIEKISSDSLLDYKDIIAKFDKFIHIYNLPGLYHEKLSILNNINKIGVLNIFFDALVYYFSKNGNYDGINKIFKTKKRINANISTENALFEMILN